MVEQIERRLAAIMVADMVAFSRLMELDEEGTVTRQKAHRAELIDRLNELGARPDEEGARLPGVVPAEGVGV